MFLLVASFVFSCTKEDFDTSPFHDKESLVYIPFSDLIDAVLVFEDKYGETPDNLSSLKSLSRNDYIDACRADGIADSIIVDDSHLNLFSDSKTKVEAIPNGLKIQYVFKDSTNIEAEYEESLYSKDFDTYIFSKYDVWIEIEEGSGTLRINFDSGETEIMISKMFGSISPGNKEFSIVNNSIVLEHSETLCF